MLPVMNIPRPIRETKSSYPRPARRKNKGAPGRSSVPLAHRRADHMTYVRSIGAAVYATGTSPPAPHDRLGRRDRTPRRTCPPGGSNARADATGHQYAPGTQKNAARQDLGRGSLSQHRAAQSVPPGSPQPALSAQAVRSPDGRRRYNQQLRPISVAVAGPDQGRGLASLPALHVG